jgi:hypothetical protein
LIAVVASAANYSGSWNQHRETCKELAALLEKQAAMPVGRMYTSLQNRLKLETAEQMAYVKANMSSSATTEDSMVTLDHMVVDASVGT